MKLAAFLETIPLLKTSELILMLAQPDAMIDQLDEDVGRDDVGNAALAIAAEIDRRIPK